MAKQDIKESDLLSIEELAKNKNIKESILNGMKVMKEWAPGKMVTEKEFNDALNGFLKSPIKG